jgi:hypothetical protein
MYRVYHQEFVTASLRLAWGGVGFAEKRTVTKHGKHVHLQIHLIETFHHQCDDPQTGLGQVSVTERTPRFVILCAWTLVSQERNDVTS